jgi:cell division initiation protein
MAVNRIDLLNHTFSRVLRGYDPEEVDSYLQDIADTMAQLGDERVRLANMVAQLEERLAAYGEREDALRETLLASQRMMEEVKLSAQKEAQLIIDSAQNRAENLTNQANLRLARIFDEISEARKLKAQFEFKVRSVIEGHLKLLELGQMEDARMERATAALGRRSDTRNEAARSEPGSGPGGHSEQRSASRNKNDGNE